MRVQPNYLKIEGFIRTRRFSHEFSKLVLQLVFRWGDATTQDAHLLDYSQPNYYYMRYVEPGQQLRQSRQALLVSN